EEARTCVSCGRPLTPEIVAAGRLRWTQARRRLYYANAALAIGGVGVFGYLYLRAPVAAAVCRYRARSAMLAYTRVLSAFETARREGLERRHLDEIRGQ